MVDFGGQNDDEENQSSLNELLMFSINDRNALARLKVAISYGKKVLLENVTEDIDSALNPLLSRSVVKKSTSLYINVGSDQIEYS
jgi:dynein heavy chain